MITTPKLFIRYITSCRRSVWRVCRPKLRDT